MPGGVHSITLSELCIDGLIDWYLRGLAAAHSVIGGNELVALDTDVVGCHGYYSDFSRTSHAGPDQLTEVEKTLYKTAYEQVHHNVSVLRAGMTAEYPYLYHHGEFSNAGDDGVIEAERRCVLRAILAKMVVRRV